MSFEFEVALNQEDVSIPVECLTDATGVPIEGMVAAQAGLVVSYQRGINTTVVTDNDAGNVNDLGSITVAHSDWDFIHSFKGVYRLDLPDAAFLVGAPYVLCNISATGITGLVTKIVINPFYKYQGTPSAVTAGSTSVPAGTNIDVGDIIVAVEGTGVKQHVLVDGVTGTSPQVATHAAWQRTPISATTTTILVIGGDDVTARGGIDVDALVSSRSTLTPAQVNSECDQALSDYDGPTRTEATADKDEILTVLPATLRNGVMRSDVSTVNGVTIIGDGDAAPFDVA